MVSQCLWLLRRIACWVPGACCPLPCLSGCTPRVTNTITHVVQQRQQQQQRGEAQQPGAGAGWPATHPMGGVRKYGRDLGARCHWLCVTRAVGWQSRAQPGMLLTRMYLPILARTHSTRRRHLERIPAPGPWLRRPTGAGRTSESVPRFHVCVVGMCASSINHVPVAT